MNKPANITILSDDLLNKISPVKINSQEDNENYIDCLIKKLDPVGVSNHCYKFNYSRTNHLYNFI